MDFNAFPPMTQKAGRLSPGVLERSKRIKTSLVPSFAIIIESSIIVWCRLHLPIEPLVGSATASLASFVDPEWCSGSFPYFCFSEATPRCFSGVRLKPVRYSVFNHLDHFAGSLHVHVVVVLSHPSESAQTRGCDLENFGDIWGGCLSKADFGPEIVTG